MTKSSKPIIEHIPSFLDYCRSVGLSNKTHDNYKHYLKKFILWLKKENKNSLPPHEFSNENIQSYKQYLINYKDQKNQPLKKVTQNYYLIALRALVGYFAVKGIESPLPSKITLSGGLKLEKRANFLNLNQISAILKIPDTKEPIGLRDRVILEVLIATGLKVAQLKDLNRINIEEKISDLRALSWVRKYLKSRKDECDALFINYRSRRNADKRLTARSIERIINFYGIKADLPFLITPEVLRWAKSQALLTEEIIIREIQEHKTFSIKSYGDKKLIEKILSNQEDNTDSPSPWHVVENAINKEICWLKDSVSSLSENYKENPVFIKNDDSILRKIAILIVSGKIKANEFVSDDKSKDLWENLTDNNNLRKISRHGQMWHKKMMDVVYEYFKSRNYKIILEPILDYGRADLGIYSDSNIFYIEVGTVSLFKIWYNLSVMKKVRFLLIPSEYNIIEFSN